MAESDAHIGAEVARDLVLKLIIGEIAAMRGPQWQGQAYRACRDVFLRIAAAQPGAAESGLITLADLFDSGDHVTGPDFGGSNTKG